MSELKVEAFVAKITDTNLPSINLFKRLGYVVEREDHDFNEVHLRFEVTDDAVAGLRAAVSKMELLPFDHDYIPPPLYVPS